MSDMTIRVGAVDAATPVLRRVRGEADRLGDSLRNAARASRAIGGGVGGIGGRVLGAAGMGGGFAAAALGGMGVMAIFTAMKGAMDRSAQMAQAQVAAMQQIAQIQRQAVQSRQSMMAGGVSLAGVARRAQARGITDPSDAFRGLGSFQEQLAATIQAQDAGLTPEQQRQATLAAQTGEVGLSDAIQGAARGRSAEQIVEMALPARPGRRRRASDLVAGARRAEGDFGSSQVSQAVEAAKTTEASQFKSLMRGDTMAAITNQQHAAMNPEAQGMRDMQRQAYEAEARLRAAADSLSTVGSLFDWGLQLATFGAARSYQQQFVDKMQENRNIFLGSE